jgi:hypothetical protein
MPHDDKLIEYLSKEIEIQSSNTMTFRTRANLSVFLGPFVLLGSVVASKGLPSGITVNGLVVRNCLSQLTHNGVPKVENLETV